MWRVTVIIQSRPDLPDTCVQTVLEIYERVIAPEITLDLFTCDELADVRNQQEQKLARLRRKLEQMSRLAQFARPRVQLEWTEAKSRARNVNALQSASGAHIISRNVSLDCVHFITAQLLRRLPRAHRFLTCRPLTARANSAKVRSAFGAFAEQPSPSSGENKCLGQ